MRLFNKSVIKWEEPALAVKAIKAQAPYKIDWLIAMHHTLVLFLISQLILNVKDNIEPSKEMEKYAILISLVIAWMMLIFLWMRRKIEPILQIVEIKNKGILRTKLDVKSGEQFISWDEISHAEIYSIIIDDEDKKLKEYSLLNIYASEDELIVTLSLAEDLDLNKLNTVFKKSGIVLI